MSRLVFLLEEYSMKVLLEGLLPRLYPDLRFQCIPHEGKQDLEKSIPRKLSAWREPGVRFCVIRDNDGGDCVALKQALLERCREGGRDDVLVRIACQELEAWYFGSPKALAATYDNKELRNLGRRARFRDPDAIVRPSVELAKLVPAYQKVAGARSMAQVMTRENRSRSFQALLDGLDRLVTRMNC